MANNIENNNKPNENLLRMTADVVAAYVSKNALTAPQVTDFIRSVYQTLTAMNGAAYAPVDSGNHKPAVAIKKSITPEYLICLEDGKKLKMLKRHLRTVYNLSPEQYRAKWGLPPDYPMTAPKYAELRSGFAKKIGLGKGATPRGARKKAA